jgi:hypothetical protein
VQDRD